MIPDENILNIAKTFQKQIGEPQLNDYVSIKDVLQQQRDADHDNLEVIDKLQEYFGEGKML